MDHSVVFFKALPKVELHRHLEGSLRLQTMLEEARTRGIAVPLEPRELSRLVSVQQDDPFTYKNFLSKFDILRAFYRSPQFIHRVTREAIEDAACDHVRYLELRFTPVAISRAEHFPLHEVMDWVCESTRKASAEFNIEVGLIASVNRHESVELAEQIAWLSAERKDKLIFGLDLAGNEAEFPSSPFQGIFKEAQQAGLHLTIHAGEWGDARNVRATIEDLATERIGHGVRILEDQETVALARDRGIPFEVCLTSNFHSGVVRSYGSHPLPQMMAAGLNVTLCTDDPSISQITLADEYQHACQDLGMTQQILKERILAAGQASFLPEKPRQVLISRLRQEMEM